MRLKSKTTATLLIAIFMISAFAVAVPVLAITTIRVPNDYLTIQEAINAAISGDTIKVAAGLYTENLVIDESITLQGADRETTIIDGMVTTAADNVIFTGFTVNGPVKAGDMWSWYSGVVISNNILENVMGASCHGLVIEDNIITSEKSEGIYLDACDNTQIKGNTITGFQKGVHEGYNHGFSGAAVFVYSRCDGTEITNNDLKDNSVGVYLATVDTMNTPANVKVNSNNLEGNDDYGVCNFRFPKGLKDPGTGDYLDYWDYGSFSAASNDIDATLNWWGTTVGADIGLMVSENVLYEPWLMGPSGQTVGMTVTSGSHELTVDIVGNGDVVPLGQDICYSGEVVTLAATPDSGWHFGEWLGEVDIQAATTTVTMLDNEAVTAIFVLDVVSISVDPISLDFGTVIMGTKSPITTITISNEGNVIVDISASVSTPFYEEYLRMGETGDLWFSVHKNHIPSIVVDGEILLDFSLDLTACREPGTHEDTLIFWAEAA